MTKLRQKFPESYSIEEYWKYIEYHLPDAMFGKLQDPARFVRFAKDNSGEVVAYFESKQSTLYSDTQVVQWILVSEKARQQGLAKKMWQEFEEWCQSKGYKSIWSFVALKNTISQQVHERLMFPTNIGIHDPHTLVFTHSVPQKGIE